MSEERHVFTVKLSDHRTITFPASETAVYVVADLRPIPFDPWLGHSPGAVLTMGRNPRDADATGEP